MEHFSFKSGRAVRVAKLTNKDRLARTGLCVTVRIPAKYNFILLLKSFMAKVPEY